MKHLKQLHAIQDSKIEKPIQECEELIPTFYFGVYKIEIDRKLYKKKNKRQALVDREMQLPEQIQQGPSTTITLSQIDNFSN